MKKRLLKWLRNMSENGYTDSEKLYAVANSMLPNLFPIPEKRNDKRMIVYWTQVISIWLGVFAIFIFATYYSANLYADTCYLQENAISNDHLEWISENWNASLNFSNISIYVGFLVEYSDMEYSDANNTNSSELYKG